MTPARKASLQRRKEKRAKEAELTRRIRVLLDRLDTCWGWPEAKYANIAGLQKLQPEIRALRSELEKLWSGS